MGSFFSYSNATENVKYENNESDENTGNSNIVYDGKLIKRILIATGHYSEDTLKIKLGCNWNDDNEIFILNKIGTFNNVNVYDLACNIPVFGTTIYLNANFNSNYLKEYNIDCPLIYQRSIFCEDDAYYNHVHDICKDNSLLPEENQTSYGVYFDSNKNAVSLFITN